MVKRNTCLSKGLAQLDITILICMKPTAAELRAPAGLSYHLELCLKDGRGVRRVEMYTHTTAAVFQMPPVRAIGTSDLRLRSEVEMAEQARAEGNIPHLRLQVFPEVALAEMEAGAEVEVG